MSLLQGHEEVWRAGSHEAVMHYETVYSRELLAHWNMYFLHRDILHSFIKFFKLNVFIPACS